MNRNGWKARREDLPLLLGEGWGEGAQHLAEILEA